MSRCIKFAKKVDAVEFQFRYSDATVNQIFANMSLLSFKIIKDVVLTL